MKAPTIFEVCSANFTAKVEMIYEDSLNSIPSPSPSVKIQTIG